MQRLNREDATKENMGITSWKGEKVRKQDIPVTKNYLSEGDYERSKEGKVIAKKIFA